jgi:hypothetical protein
MRVRGSGEIDPIHANAAIGAKFEVIGDAQVE